MPPRKRAEPKPAGPEIPVSEPQVDKTTPPGHPMAEEPPAETPPPDGGPKKSDLQSVEQPCESCFPNGWADGAFSHGCEHGTWIRDNT